jgi:signal peptidase I
VAKKEFTKEEKPRETRVEFLVSLASFLVTALFIVTFIFQNFEIPSSSMENTLLIGDHVLVNHVQFSPATRWLGRLLPYRAIERGDIVVFLHPRQPGLYVVKRIIGIPGDRIHLRNGSVYRNGQKLDEPYTIPHDSDQPFDYRDNFPEEPPQANAQYPDGEISLRSHIEGDDLVVPPNNYRDVSLDSRFWGFIPQENIVGRPLLIYWSFETPNGQYLKTGFADQASFIANVVFHFFDETRWNRTLRIVR